MASGLSAWKRASVTVPPYSVVIPVFNEQGNIGPLLKNLRASIGHLPQVVVVDDGSTDKTLSEIDRKLCDLISHERNQGKGASLRTGVACCDSDLIIFMDGDGQDDPNDIHLLLEALQNGADVALGSRFIQQDPASSSRRFDDEAVLPVNHFGNRVITGLINFFFRAHLTDAMASLRGYRADTLRQIKWHSNRYEIETEMIIQVLKKKLNVIEVPVGRRRRGHGKSQLFDVAFGRSRFAVRALFQIVKGRFWY